MTEKSIFIPVIPDITSIPFKFKLITRNSNMNNCWHDTYEFFFLNKGKNAQFEVNNKTFKISKDEFLCVNPYETHKFLLADDNFELLKIALPLFFLKNVNVSQFIYDLPTVIHNSTSRINHLLIAEAEEFIEANETRSKLESRVEMIGLVYSISGLLFSRYSKKLNMPFLNKVSNKFVYIKKALDYLQNHYMENISVDYLASKVNLSNSYFSHIFKSLTGKTPLTMINEIRIAHAKQLIANTDRNMLDIAIQVGFVNLKAMNKVFRQYYQLTSYQWKLKKAGNDLF